ncbi:MAG TPA: DUF1592 domain-containing protein [Abditibacteriaceae bacterium]
MNKHFLLSSAALLSVAVLRVAAGNTPPVYIAAAKPPKVAHPTAKSGPLPEKTDAEGKVMAAFIENRCLSCHDTATQKGGLDLEKLTLNLDDARTFETWVKVHDMVRDGTMPPPKKAQPTTQERAAFKNRLAGKLIAAEDKKMSVSGRAVWRRLNRYEYENTVRDLLGINWLELREMLPEDGEAFRFNKVGEALDVSHVQMARYLQTADFALRQTLGQNATQPQATTKRFYTREEQAFFGGYDIGPEVRSTFPVLGSQQDQAHLKPPYSVGDKDPKVREEEGVGVVLSTYEPTEIRWSRFRAPVAGRYKLRFLTNTIWVGPKNEKQWWVPNYSQLSAGRRTEPILIYSDRSPRLLRYLGSFEAAPEAKVNEIEAWLQQGESIRPDAVRFFRPRPGSMRNPWATPEGQPAVSFRWMEVEGPLYDEWPTRGQKLLFGDLPFKQNGKSIEVTSDNPQRDGEKLLRGFMQRAYRRPVSEADVQRFLPIIGKAMEQGYGFGDAMIAVYSAVLCSPGFLYLEEKTGALDNYALASRLSYFLWNAAPDEELLKVAAAKQLSKPEVLRAQTNRLLDDARSERFINAFLDYWLDLRKINNNDADVTLYPDYQLDDGLIASATNETRAFFKELLKNDLPVKNIVASDFAMLNERMAVLYNIPNVEGNQIRRVQLPADSPRGGLMTQASILKVTANGTTTSPVLRGAWIMERILGEPPPPPPPSIPAVEPDTRGATTIRELLDKHRADPGCAGCHTKIDPAGFALESFDVMGGFRQNYRAVGNGEGKFQKIEGYGRNGDVFRIFTGPPVDSSGQLWDGRPFKDVRELKALLCTDERKLARNVTKQLTIYGTGAPVRFVDRPKLEAILNRAQNKGYGVRTLLHEIVQSELFVKK